MPKPSFRSLIGLAWPIVVSRSSQVVIGLSDALLVASLGEASLAATTTGALNTFMLLILPMGTAFIVSSFAAQLFGKGDAAGARRYGFYGLGLALGTLAVSFIAIALVPTILGHMSYTPEVRDLMTDYLKMRLLSAGAAIGIEALANYYGGIGNTRTPMIANVTAMILNVIGNLVLIHGHLGAPALGVKGSALASTLATTIAFVGLLAKFLHDGRAAGVVFPKLSAREFGRMLRFGLPSGFNWFFEFFAFSFFINVVVTGLGTTTLAAMMSVFQINSVSFMPAFGIASAGAILAGQAIGADRRDDVPAIVGLAFKTAALWQGLVGLAYVAIPEILFAPFIQGPGDHTELRILGARMLALSAAWQLFDAAANSIAEALRAAGDTAFTLWTRVAVAWLVFVPGSYLSVRYGGGGARVAVAWLVLYLGLLALVLYLRFRSGAWRRIQLVEPALTP